MIDFNSEQIEAIYKAEEWYKSLKESPSSVLSNRRKQVFEISGPAGSGKTTLVKYIIENLGIDMNEVRFVAFMGKAAVQLQRNGLPAQTIHSLIYDVVMEPVFDENGKPVILPSGNQKRKLAFCLKHDLFTDDDNEIKLIVVDEAGMVSGEIAEDLLSFGIPIIALGDLNQLKNPFGSEYFLVKPDIVLTKIHRQSEDSPVIWLSQEILKNHHLTPGQYGTSTVVKRSDFDPEMISKSDAVLCCTNQLRYAVNDMFRRDIKSLHHRLDVPNIGEKIICRRNKWNKSLMYKGTEYFLCNGISGTVEYVDVSSYNGKKLEIDFKPDFLPKSFHNLAMDYKHLYAPYGSEDYDAIHLDLVPFEFAYALTVHLSQGSQYNDVAYFAEDGKFDNITKRKLNYTAITRAIDRITIFI